MARRLTSRVWMAVCGLWLAGCNGPHSALDPAGSQARHIDWLWGWLFWVCLVVFVVVIALLVVGVLRKQQAADRANPPREIERRHTWVIGGGIGATAVVLLVLLVASVVTGRSLTAVEKPDALIITVTANQWWWKVRYENEIASNIVVTANEIHIPVGEPVQLKLQSSDVIHSFWVPNLHGKRDMIPGHVTSLWIHADRPGTFEGQCAEFCGHQHARMRLLVVAQPADEFQRWLEHQRTPARPPQSETELRGREVFLSTTCIMCHTVRGTVAGGTVAPDLTHVASRRTLAAGTLPNTRGHLGGWVMDPQQIKPGNRMPPNPLTSEELRALLDYLTSLE